MTCDGFESRIKFTIFDKLGTLSAIGFSENTRALELELLDPLGRRPIKGHPSGAHSTGILPICANGYAISKVTSPATLNHGLQTVYDMGPPRLSVKEFSGIRAGPFHLTEDIKRGPSPRAYARNNIRRSADIPSFVV